MTLPPLGASPPATLSEHKVVLGSIVGGGGMNFEKCFCFDGENMPNSARYYTDDKSKLLGDVSFIKKNNNPKNKLMW